MSCDLQSTGRQFSQLRCVNCNGVVYSSSTRRTTCRKTGEWCEYQPTGDVLYEMKCQRDKCQQVVTSKYIDPAMRSHPCKAEPQPSVANKAWSLAAATAKWIAAGSPKRSAEEIATCYEVCASCPKFRPHASDADKGSCDICGCNLRKNGGLINKIPMATEHCPLAKW